MPRERIENGDGIGEKGSNPFDDQRLQAGCGQSLPACFVRIA